MFIDLTFKIFLLLCLSTGFVILSTEVGFSSEINGSLKFADGRIFTPPTLKAAARDMLSIPDGLDPFSRGLLKSFIADKPETVQFFDFIFNGFQNRMKNFSPLARESWETLLTTAFISHVQEFKGAHLDIMISSIIPEYPLLTDEPIEQILLSLFDDEDEYIGHLMPSTLLESKACKVFCKKYMENFDKADFDFKQLLKDARKSASMIDPASKYHLAFLYGIDNSELSNIGLDFDDFDFCFAFLAKSIYNNGLSGSINNQNNVVLRLCMILPFVFDKIREDLGYLEVINQYVFSEQDSVDIQAFSVKLNEFLKYITKGTAKLFIEPEQLEFFKKLASGSSPSKLVLQYVARYMEAPENCLGYDEVISNRWRLFGFALVHRISSIYPDFMMEQFDVTPETFEKYNTTLMTAFCIRETIYYFKICAYEASSSPVMRQTFPMGSFDWRKYSALIYFGPNSQLDTFTIRKIRALGNAKTINILNRRFSNL